MPPNLLNEAQELGPALQAWRRRLHAHPELSGQEAETARFVAAELKKLGLSPVERLNGTHGLLADIGADRPGAVVALRADMDALPIHEETGLEYASRSPGVMHACGHDAHVAMLLGAAQLLKRHERELKRPVRLLFQPHEEKYPGGAPDMIAGGGLRNVERIFGIHICSTLPVGQLGARAGAFMAAVNTFSIRVIGRGGHAAMPDECIDPVVAAAHIIAALQTIVSRSLALTDAAVVSVTQLAGGSADNVIPNEVTLGGTIRTFDPRVRELTGRRVQEIAQGVAHSLGASAEVKIHPGYPVLVNDAEMTRRAFDAARALGFGDERLIEMRPIGGGEDFAYYLEKTPGAFVFLGAKNDAKQCRYPHHHPRFDIDEDALAMGAALHARFALDA
jgi:amidohydrolase